MQIVLVVIGASFLCLIGLGLVAAVGWAYVDIRRKVDALTKALTVAAELSKAADYLQGLVNICGDQVKAIVELKGTVDKFHSTVFPGENKSTEKAAWQPYSEDAADEAFEVEQLVAQGFPPLEARERVTAGRMEAQRKSNEEFGRFRLA